MVWSWRAPIIDRVYGPKNLQTIAYWIPSAIAYGATLAVFVPWFTDWRYFMKKVPWYNQRFLYPYEDDKIVYTKPYYTLEDDDQAVPFK